MRKEDCVQVKLEQQKLSSCCFPRTMDKYMYIYVYIYIYIYERETSVCMCYTITVKQKTFV